MDRAQHQLEVTFTSKAAPSLTEACCIRRLTELVRVYRALYVSLGGREFTVSHVAIAEHGTKVTLILAVDDRDIGTVFMQAVNVVAQSGSSLSPERN